MDTAQFELPVRWQVLSLFWSFTWLFLNSWKTKSPSMEVFHLPREGPDFLVAGLVDSCAYHYKSNIGAHIWNSNCIKLLSHLVLSSMDSFFQLKLYSLLDWSLLGHILIFFPILITCFKHDQYDFGHELDWGETFLNDKTRWVVILGRDNFLVLPWENLDSQGNLKLSLSLSL